MSSVSSLYAGTGNFNYRATKFGDNGLVETEQEVSRYLGEYRRRTAVEYLPGVLDDKLKDFALRLAGRNSRLYGALKSACFQLR